MYLCVSVYVKWRDLVLAFWIYTHAKYHPASQLADGPMNAERGPEKAPVIPQLEATEIKQIACGGYHCAAITGINQLNSYN